MGSVPNFWVEIFGEGFGSAYQFIADTSYVDDADTFIFGQFVAQFGDEYMQAALVEEGIVSPKVEQDVLGIHYAVPVLAETVEDSGFPVGEFLGNAVVQEHLSADIQLIVPDFIEGLLLLNGRGIRTGTTY